MIAESLLPGATSGAKPYSTMESRFGTERSLSALHLLCSWVCRALKYPHRKRLIRLRFLTVDFDTGSSDLFLPGVGCQESCGNHRRYDPSKSSTAVALDLSFTLAFGDGSTMGGEQYDDSVSIAGSCVLVL